MFVSHLNLLIAMVDCYASYQYIIVNTVSNLITYTIKINVRRNYCLQHVTSPALYQEGKVRLTVSALFREEVACSSIIICQLYLINSTSWTPHNPNTTLFHILDKVSALIKNVMLWKSLCEGEMLEIFVHMSEYFFCFNWYHYKVICVCLT